MTSLKTIALVLVLVVAAAVALPTAALARTDNYVLCEEPFTNIPVKAGPTLNFRVVGLTRKSLDVVACKRGQAVIQAGFTKFGTKTLSYNQVGKLHVVVSGRKYTFALPQPAASGSYAWKGAIMRIQYSLPTGK